MSELRAPQVVETVQETTPQVVDNVSSEVQTKVPELLATYSEDQGKPYVAKYYDIENIWDDQPSMRYEVNLIEGFLQDQIKQGKLDNSVKAGEDFLKDLERRAEISPYESVNQKITKLIAYIEFRRIVDK